MSADDSANFIDKRADRRRFIGRAGMVGLGVLGANKLTGMAQSPEITDADVLNFALNQEYLEAEYYLRGAFGRGLNAGDVDGVGVLGPVIGGRAVPFQTNELRQYAEEIALDEETHVRFVRSTLGAARIARPQINYEQGFTIAARLAGVVGATETFDPFLNEENFFLGGFLFSDVGVTAYVGGARFLTNPDIIEAASRILAVEGYHASILRLKLFERGRAATVKQISDARDSLDGAEDKDQGVIETGGAAITSTQGVNITPTDANGLAFARTFEQVLSIAYLGGRANNFGFFPRRANGRIR